MQRHKTQAVLTLLQGFGRALGIFVRLGGLGGEGDLLLPGLHLGDAHFQRHFLFGHDEGVALLDVGAFGQGCPLEVRIQRTQLAEGQVVLPGDGPQGVASLDRVGLLLLADAGDHILDGIVVLEAVVEIDAVFEQNGLAEADGDVFVVLVLFLVGSQQAVQVAAQGVAVCAHGRQLTVQVESRALADLVAGALQDGVGGLALVHDLMRHRDGIARLDGPVGLVRTGVIDTLHHVLTGKVEDSFVGHIADGLPIDLHRQGIGLLDGAVIHRHEHRQHTHRQDVHGHPGQQPKVAPDAAGKIMNAGFDGRAEAFLLPDRAGMHQQCPRAPEKEDHRAEQVPEHLGSAGERQRGQLMEHIADAVRQPPRDGGDIPARAHHSIFGGKAQRIQGLAHPQHQSAPPQLLRKVVHAALRLPAEAVFPQQPAALELCPEGPQRPLVLHRRC